MRWTETTRIPFLLFNDLFIVSSTLITTIIIINVKKILAVISATYAVAKRKPEKKSGLPGFEP